MNVVIEILSIVASRASRAGFLATVCLSGGGCASLKKMSEDFNRKWDDPKSIIAEMDESANANRAADSSAEQMAAVNSDDCARRFKLADEKAPDFAGRRLSAGECLLEEGKDEDAAKLFGAIADEGANAQALQGRGVALVRLGRFEEGATSLQAALDLDETLWRAWNAKGVAADYEGDAGVAEASFRKAAELNPSDGAALNNLGVSLVKAGRREEAIVAFRQAVAVDGAREPAEVNLRLAYAMQGDYLSAVKALPEGERPTALNNAGVAAATRGDKDEAKRLFARALEESPHFYAKAYNNLTLLVE